MNGENIIKYGLCTICIIVGVIAVFFGFKTAPNTKNYKETKGYYFGKDIYSEDSDGVTYKLFYKYSVDGTEYTYVTDYGTGSIPDDDTVVTIMYDKSNPDNAFIKGASSNILLLVIGFMFVVIPLIMIFADNQLGINDFIIPIVFFILGCAFYYLMTMNNGTLSFFKAFKTNGLFIFVPILFIIVGIYGFIYNFLPKK